LTFLQGQIHGSSVLIIRILIQVWRILNLNAKEDESLRRFAPVSWGQGFPVHLDGHVGQTRDVAQTALKVLRAATIFRFQRNDAAVVAGTKPPQMKIVDTGFSPIPQGFPDLPLHGLILAVVQIEIMGAAEHVFISQALMIFQ
jgi:hypothetical protein